MTSQSFIVAHPSGLRALTAYLERRLEAGKPLRVTVGARPSRTREQNAFLHLAIRQLANHVGMSETELKEVLKSEFGPEETVRVGNLTTVVRKSMSKYSTLEASAMIEHVERIAAECGLLIEPAAGAL